MNKWKGGGEGGKGVYLHSVILEKGGEGASVSVCQAAELIKMEQMGHHTSAQK